MSFFENMIYGLISGLAEFLPISSQAHEVLLLELLGIDRIPAIARLLNHLAMALALYTCCSGTLRSLYKELELSQRPRRRRSRDPIKRSIYDIALIRTAFYPLALGYFCYPYTTRIQDDIQWVALFLVINGIVLLVPPYIRSGNKDSLSMTRLDATVLGVAAGFSVIPGVSRMATFTAVGSIRGADRQQTLHWALLITIPALAFMLGFDIRDMILQGIGVAGIGEMVCCLIGAGFAYLGATFAIQIMRFLSVNTGYSGFSYYCWGLALFTFVLYLL